MVYNLSIADLSEQQRLDWHSPDSDVKMCVVKGKDEVINFYLINELFGIFFYLIKYLYNTSMNDLN